MTMFIIQSAILLAIAFIIGCIIGCLLRRMFASDEASVPAVAAATATVATVAAVAPRLNAVEATPEPVAAPAPKPAPVAAPVMAAPPAPAPKAAPKPAPKSAPKSAAKPKAASAPAAVAAKPAKPDDLKLIVGIGPVNERKLHGLGVNRFAHIAAWTPSDEKSIGEKLEFPGRIEREEWVRQARNLAAGGASEDTAELGRRKGASSTGAKGSSTAKGSAKPVGIKSQSAKAPSAKTAAPAKKPIPMKLDKPIGGKPDNLTLINGIGNVIEKKLYDMGVFHFEQIANWTLDHAETFSKAVGFPGRALREGWVKEAAIFAKGGTTDHAKKVEAGKITTSRVSSAAEKGKKK